MEDAEGAAGPAENVTLQLLLAGAALCSGKRFNQQGANANTDTHEGPAN